MSLTLNQKLNRFPPIACRLLARRKHRQGGGVVAVTDEELAAKSQLSMARIKAISWSLSWDEISCADMLAFTKACGIDFESRRCLWRHNLYQKSGAFMHLRRSPMWETQFVPLVEEWHRSKRN